jgi:hypothetical protein
MDADARTDKTEGRRVFVMASLTGAAFLLLAAAGGLLWARQGDAVFTDLVTAALAWCF